MHLSWLERQIHVAFLISGNTAYDLASPAFVLVVNETQIFLSVVMGEGSYYARLVPPQGKMQ